MHFNIATHWTVRCCIEVQISTIVEYFNASMEAVRWSQYIKPIYIRPRLRKNGKLCFGMNFYGGSENGMLIRCSHIRRVRYILRGNRTEATVAGRHLWYKEKSAVVCEGDIVLYFNESLCTGMPLDYFLNVVIGTRLSMDGLNEITSLKLVSSTYFTGSASRNRPGELANILTLTYNPDSEEEHFQGKIRYAAYDLLWPITTHPQHPLNHDINGFPAHYNYVTEADFDRYKTEHRLLESGVSADGYHYGTLLPRPPTYDYSVRIPDYHYGHDKLPRTMSYYDALNLEPNLGGRSTPVWPVKNLAAVTVSDSPRAPKSSWSLFDKLRRLNLRVRIRWSLWRQRKMASCWDLYEELKKEAMNSETELARLHHYDDDYPVQYIDMGDSENFEDDPECVGVELRYHQDSAHHFE